MNRWEGCFIENSNLFSAGDFAKISRTTLRTLHHYDKIGLLEPVFRKDNNYRCYSIRQLADINVIRTLQKVGVPLTEIKALREQRTPELAREIFLRQIKVLDEKANDLLCAKELMSTLLASIQSGLSADKEAITVQYIPSEPMILGERNDYSGDKNAYDALFEFYQSFLGKLSDWERSYPVWGIFSEERIKRRDWQWPDRYYLYSPNGQAQRPAGLYAVGYTYTGYGMGSALHERMLRYIERHNFEICGDAYEEYPLNEICITDETNYLMRLMITVREKQKD
jgi:DNA-binding transcriptional MerR regulator/effector-binding domain-containing protein